MPRGRTAKSNQKKGPRGRHRPFNRNLKLNMKDVLSMARELSGAGHPHDFIPSDAVIETVKAGRGQRYVIRWHGVDQKHPGYGAEPGTPEARAASDAAKPFTIKDAL